MFVIVDIKTRYKLTSTVFADRKAAQAAADELGEGCGGVMLAADWKEPYT